MANCSCNERSTLRFCGKTIDWAIFWAANVSWNVHIWGLDTNWINWDWCHTSALLWWHFSVSLRRCSVTEVVYNVMYEHLKNIWLQSLTEDFLLRLAQTDPSRSSGHVYHRFTVRPGILKACVKAMRARKVRCDIGIRQRLKYLSGGVAATL